MIWTLDMDDFNRKHCNDGKYPLLRVVARELGPAPEPPATTNLPKTTKETTAAPTKASTAPTKLPTTTKRTSAAPTTSNPTECRPVGLYKNSPGMLVWCKSNCA